VNDTDGVDGMQRQPLENASILRSDQIVVIGISVDDAAASGRDAIQSVLIDWLKERQNGAGSLYLPGFDELFTAPELARCDVILLAGHHHWNDRPGL
jgi:hypothetical protein